MRTFAATLLLLGVYATVAFECPESTGLYPDETNCSRFVQCSNWSPYTFDCPRGLHFMAERLICEWPHIANCNASFAIATTTDSPPELETAPTETADDRDFSPEETSTTADTATASEVTDQELGNRCPPLGASSSLRWRRWQYGETMPKDVLKVGERFFESTSGRVTAQFSTIVQVFINGTKYFGTTMGPSKFANSGLYFVLNGQLVERNYEYVQILCVNSDVEHTLFWMPAFRGSCAPEGASIIDDEFLIGRAAHDRDLGLVVASGVKQGEPLITAFKFLRTHDEYEVLVERRPDIGGRSL